MGHGRLVIGKAGKLVQVAVNDNPISSKADLHSKDAAGAFLTRDAVAQRRANGFALGDNLNLATTARSGPYLHPLLLPSVHSKDSEIPRSCYVSVRS